MMFFTLIDPSGISTDPGVYVTPSVAHASTAPATRTTTARVYRTGVRASRPRPVRAPAGERTEPRGLAFRRRPLTVPVRRTTLRRRRRPRTRAGERRALRRAETAARKDRNGRLARAGPPGRRKGPQRGRSGCHDVSAAAAARGGRRVALRRDG